jgi:amino acid transporter
LLLRVKGRGWARMHAGIVILNVIALIVSTVIGLRWYIDINNEQDNESKFSLKTEYQVASVIYLGLPIVIATFFMIILVIFIGILLYEYRRNRNWRGGERFEDD